MTSSDDGVTVPLMKPSVDHDESLFTWSTASDDHFDGGTDLFDVDEEYV